MQIRWSVQDPWGSLHKHIQSDRISMPLIIEEVKAVEKKMMAARADQLDYIQGTMAKVRNRQTRDRLDHELTEPLRNIAT